MQRNFVGEIIRKLDTHNRVLLPPQFYADFAAGLVITRGLEKCLMVYPMDEWQHLATKLQTLPLVSSLAREFQRLLFSGTTTAALDHTGQLLIPQHLRAYANLGREIIVIGLGTHLEIWNLNAWHQKRAEFESHVADIEHWASLGI